MKTNMDYSLSQIEGKEPKNTLKAWATMWPLLRGEKKGLAVAFVTVILNAVLTLLGPLVVGFAIDRYVVAGNYAGVLWSSAVLLVIYLAAFASNYIQMRSMGQVAQRTLWKLRNDVFEKLQELPLAFFTQNKSGDLISRVNSDTEKLNQFFSEGLMRFAGNIFIIIGAGVFLLSIDLPLGSAALAPAVAIALFSLALRSLVSKRNAENLKATGEFSGEVDESMRNFKVILAFGRRDYFKKRFAEANMRNYSAAVRAGTVNELFTPVFEFFGNLAQLVVLGVGLYFVAQGSVEIGILVAFVLYVTRFYDPLREMARLWATFQVALAAWDRIRRLLRLKSDLEVVPDAGDKAGAGKGLIEFRNVSFSYPNGSVVLHDVSLTFEKGKTYALVGPTGGGKTTTASLIARLYDPTSGTVYLSGRDIRSYDPAERAKKIGFILQDAFLFSGTVRDNLLYGNSELTPDTLEAALERAGLSSLVRRFDKGLDTKVGGNAALSLGERQIVAFVRAVLRRPEILILDEATANIDTVTEKVLEDIIDKLPKETTRVIIAHRLNTIERADDIFFVNGGEVREAGSMEHAVEMLLHHKRKS